MKIKNVSVHAKRSKAYQTFEVGLEVEITDNDNVEEVIKELQIKANKHCLNALQELI